MVPVRRAAGLVWVAQVSTVNVAAQTVLRGWVRARGLRIFMIVFNGMMALGSSAWGLIASIVGLSWTFALAGVSLLRFELAATGWRIPGGDWELQGSAAVAAPLRRRNRIVRRRRTACLRTLVSTDR